jgi:hypothetical protein
MAPVHQVPRCWLQFYVDEYAWRWNSRRKLDSLFNQLLARATRSERLRGFRHRPVLGEDGPAA